MFNLMTTFALCILPMGASIDLNNIGECATSDYMPSLKVCIDYNSDTLIIQHGIHVHQGSSPELRELIENI